MQRRSARLAIAIALPAVVLVPAGSAAAATFTVAHVGSSGEGSLQDAVAKANADPGPDVIDFADEVRGTITLPDTQLEISAPVSIDGPGADQLTVSARKQTRVFQIAPGVSAAISGLTLADGFAFNPGTDRRYGGDAYGGAIYNAGALTLVGVAVRNSVAAGASGDRAGGDAHGGGIFSSGALTVERSTIAGNLAEGGKSLIGGQGVGGGIESTGSLTITATTVSGNTARGGFGYDEGGDVVGGGIRTTGNASLTNSTVSGNTATGGPGPKECGGCRDRTGVSRGGGLSSDSPFRTPGALALTSATITNNGAASGANIDPGVFTNATAVDTIFSAPRSGGDSRGAGDNCGKGLKSNGFNLEDGRSCGLNQPGDLSSTNPKLGPLQDNGGPTMTHAITKASPALDQGIGRGLVADQRVLTRPVQIAGVPKPPGGDASDIGAFELQGLTADRLQIAGSVRPRAAPVGTRTCFRFDVELPSGLALEGAKLRFAGRSERSDRRGRAVICKRPSKAGTRVAQISKPELAPDRVRVRIRRR